MSKTSPRPSVDEERRRERRQAAADAARRAKEFIDALADVSPEEELREALDAFYSWYRRHGGRRDVPHDNTKVTLSEHFSAADILELAARREVLDAQERAAYGRYLFGDAEPATKAECRKALNQFLQRAAGQEPAEDLEKDFLVRALQFYARKWDLTLHFQDAAGASPCRISTAPNRDAKYARAFRLVEPGRQGRTLASRNAVPDLTFRP